MKKVLYIVVAMMAALSSCSSSEDITESNGTSTGLSTGTPMEFTATIVNENGSVGSRSTLGTDSHPNWEATDMVNINGSMFAVVPNTTAPTKADLKLSSGALSLSAPYKALFAGGDTQADDWDGTNFNFKLPATYTYTPGKFNMPMYAESNTKALNFYNICAVLAVKVTSAGLATVKTITVTSDNVICGSYTISGDGTTTKYTAVSSSTADKDKTVTINCGDGVATTSEATVFYLPVIPGSHNLAVTVSDGTTTKSWSATNPVTIERSKIYGLSFAGDQLIINSVGLGNWTESGSKTVYMNGYAVRIAGTTSDLCFNMSQSDNTLTIIAVPTSSTASGRTPTITPSSAGSSTLSGNICTTTLNNITSDVTVTY